MTNHLAAMNVGDEIEIRGPKGAMQYSRTYAKNIGMIAGGTGITPMYQLIRAICEDEEDNTQISLLYASNSEEDILLREELDAFAAKNPHKFKFQHVLAKPKDSWTGLQGFINQDMIKEHLAPATDSSKVLLCGPPPMINAMKKNLAGLGWKEPGAISKASDPVFLF
jgi:cytochrome-b5 reductase